MSTDIKSQENMSETLVNSAPPEEMDSKKRKLSGWQYWVVAGIALTASTFHLYTAAFGLFAAMYQRGIHWMLMGVLLFLQYPISKNRPKDRIDPWDWFLAGLLALGCLNILFNWPAIAMRQGAAIPSDIYLGIIMVVLVIEGTRDRKSVV